MNKKQMVVKDNSMIGASYSLGVAEQRLIFLAIIEAREQETLIKAGGLLRITAKSYEKQFNVEKHTAYKVLKDACNGLYEAEFKYSYADKRTGKLFHAKSRFVQKIAYADDLGCVELIFAEDVVPLITRLEERYTEYELKQVSALQSEYAIRLYELIAQWRTVGKINRIPLDELRNKLGVKPEKYKKMCNFKARVLDLAVKQVNDFTDIDVKYDQHKNGKTITAISFIFKHKITANTIAADDNSFIKLSPSQIAIFSAKLAELNELGSNAPMGKTTEEFAAIIADHLAHETKQAKYIPYLVKVGYKKSKPKS